MSTWLVRVSRSCIKVLLITFMLQYCFATPKPLKARPEAVVLRNRSFVQPRPGEDSPPPSLQFPPFPHKQPVTQARPALRRRSRLRSGLWIL